MRIIAPLLKLGLGGGAVYFVVDQGLFGVSQKETIETGKKIVNSTFSKIPADLQPYLQQIPKFPSKDDMIDYWNSGVKISIKFLSDLPDNSKDAASKSFTYLKDEMKKQMQTQQK